MTKRNKEIQKKAIKNTEKKKEKNIEHYLICLQFLFIIN